MVATLRGADLQGLLVRASTLLHALEHLAALEAKVVDLEAELAAMEDDPSLFFSAENESEGAADYLDLPATSTQPVEAALLVVGGGRLAHRIPAAIGVQIVDLAELGLRLGRTRQVVLEELVELHGERVALALAVQLGDVLLALLHADNPFAVAQASYPSFQALNQKRARIAARRST